MWLLVGFGIIALLSVPFFLSLRRATELFVLRVRNGEVSVARGRLPERLFRDIQDVLRRTPPKQAEVKTIVSAKRPKLIVSGDIPEGQLQQLRNVVGRYETAQIRAGKHR